MTAQEAKAKVLEIWPEAQESFFGDQYSDGIEIWSDRYSEGGEEIGGGRRMTSDEAWIDAASRLPVEPKAQVESASVEKNNPVLDAEPKSGVRLNKPSEAKATLMTEGRTGTANVPTGTKIEPKEVESASALHEFEPDDRFHLVCNKCGRERHDRKYHKVESASVDLRAPRPDVDMYPQHVCEGECHYLNMLEEETKPTDLNHIGEMEAADCEGCGDPDCPCNGHEMTDAELRDNGIDPEKLNQIADELYKKYPKPAHIDTPAPVVLKPELQPDWGADEYTSRIPPKPAPQAEAQASFEQWFTDEWADKYLYGAEGPARDTWNAQQAKIEALEKQLEIDRDFSRFTVKRAADAKILRDHTQAQLTAAESRIAELEEKLREGK